MVLTNHGFLTKEQMLEMLKPNGLDGMAIAGRRIRWAYVTKRSDERETKLVSDSLKERHLQLGASEVLVHHGPWIEEDKDI